MASKRILTGTLSLILASIVVTSSFYQSLGEGNAYPMILNPKFKYLTRDRETGGYKPFLWEVTYTKGPGDHALTRHDTVEGVECLGLHVYQDGANDTYNWASIHVKQMFRGEYISRLFESRMEVWVYPNFSFSRDPLSMEPWNVFGVEVNDGKNMMWIIFSDGQDEVYQLRNHRIILVSTPLNRWSNRQIDLDKLYLDAGWERPEDLSLILICGATKMVSGKYNGYIREIRVEKK
ncbi:MAG: hypothetical protein ACUVTM_01340 [Candidatus Bathyarchaeia archaeon]